ncbi:MAG TPA: hypothetical protein PKV73_01380 [Agriterribacter sp.]|nr:hypothetical protein [Agriterribacter sp.]
MLTANVEALQKAGKLEYVCRLRLVQKFNSIPIAHSSTSALLFAMHLLGGVNCQTMLMYKTAKWSEKIEEREVLKTTDKSVYFTAHNREQKELKHTSYYDWHDTKQDAVNFLKKRYLSKIEYAEKEIAEAKRNLELLGV